MGFTYLDNKNWSQVTRDERTFCADLYMLLQDKEKLKLFTQWLSKECNLGEMDTSNEIEIGFEVTFLRDVLFDFELKNGKKAAGKDRIKGALKRTIDLAIFLPNDIIIIEAKAAESLTTKQMNDFDKDEKTIKSLLRALDRNPPNIHLVGLVSSEYDPRFTTQEKFKNRIIAWEQLEKLDIGYTQRETLKKIYSNTAKIANAAKMDSRIIDNLINEIESTYKS